MARVRTTEWATVGLGAVIYGTWLGIVASHRSVPGWATVTVLAVVIAWHGSLQHEVLHGHPFRQRWANSALGWPPLSLRLPYFAYRRDHLDHHASVDLTDPDDDVESFYVSAKDWDDASRGRRLFLVAHHTFVGRLVLGPPCEVLTVVRAHLRAIRGGDRLLGRWWAAHLLGVGAVLFVAVGVFTLPVWQYLLAGYLSHSLTLVRSYCEHRWVPDGAPRSAVVEAGPFFALLFLNNNLHLTHHDSPGAPWYALPRLSREQRSADRAATGAGRYSGYGEIFRRHARRPFDTPIHPRDRIRA